MRIQLLYQEAQGSLPIITERQRCLLLLFLFLKELYFGNENENRSDSIFFIHIENEYSSTLCIESKEINLRADDGEERMVPERHRLLSTTFSLVLKQRLLFPIRFI